MGYFEKKGTNTFYIHAIKTLYKDNQAIIKVEGETSVHFHPTKGVKQGCYFSQIFVSEDQEGM